MPKCLYMTTFAQTCTSPEMRGFLQLVYGVSSSFKRCITLRSRQQTSRQKRIATDILDGAFCIYVVAMSVISNLGSLKQLSQLIDPGKVICLGRASDASILILHFCVALSLFRNGLSTILSSCTILSWLQRLLGILVRQDCISLAIGQPQDQTAAPLGWVVGLHAAVTEPLV